MIDVLRFVVGVVRQVNRPRGRLGLARVSFFRLGISSEDSAVPPSTPSRRGRDRGPH